MALLNISGDIWSQCAPFRHHPSNNIFTVHPLSEHLPSHDHPSYQVACSRYIFNGVCHDHRNVLFCLCAIVGHVVKLFYLSDLDCGCCCICSDVFWGSIDHHVS